MEKDLKGDLFKKIIQLTRKLYLINSKNEESNAIIDAIIRSYTLRFLGLINLSDIIEL